MDDDAQIYIRNLIIETLCSFYVSPLSDNDSKELILRVSNMPIIMTLSFLVYYFTSAHCVSSWLLFCMIFLKMFLE